MLVLLVVLMVTAPLLTQAVKVDLPRAAAAPVEQKPDIVRLTLDAAGTLYWDGKPLGAEELPTQLAAAAARTPQPDVHLSADKATRYEFVARAMGEVRAAGIARLRFVTLPGEHHGSRP
jgi:biopolymer transport protein ExbD